MSAINPADANVLITGGSEGIGLGLASRLLTAGATVLVTGRSAEKLDQAAQAHPGLRTFVNDIGQAGERKRLADSVRETLPTLNVVINNAGIQRRLSLAEDHAPWVERQAEIDILLAGPIHLNHLLIPVLLAHGKPSVIANVSSGGAYLPQPFAPIYSACKAAIHSYTMNLRFALAGTNCRVVEIIPPAVRTALAGPGEPHGEPVDAFTDAVFSKLVAGDVEIGYGITASSAIGDRLRVENQMFSDFSGRFPITTYAGR